MNREEFREKAKGLGFSDVEIDYIIEKAEVVAQDTDKIAKNLGLKVENYPDYLVEFGLNNLYNSWRMNGVLVAVTKLKIAQAMANKSGSSEYLIQHPSSFYDIMY